MKRLEVKQREGWQKQFEELGFTFHSMDGCYWSEGVCYEFSSGQIDYLEAVTQELYDMCIDAADHVISNNLFPKLGLDEHAAALIKESWNRDDISIYGRFDFSYNGKDQPKLLEFNADTPTSLYESSVAQWVWLEDMFPEYDQFNSIHEKLTESFNAIKQKMPIVATMYFSCVQDMEEDFVTVEYMRDVASQAGIETKHIYMEDIGYNEELKKFTDLDERPVDYMFKLYPWEWLLADEFGKKITPDVITFYEPAWKMLLSNKGILPILWELFPGHKNLLPSYFDSKDLGGNYVKKPMLSREGANIEFRRGEKVITTEGTYGDGAYIYQAISELPSFEGRYAVVGSWIVNNLACGMGIREDESFITKNTSNFVPHYFR
jgi:glutathionylspermidine synthase